MNRLITVFFFVLIPSLLFAQEGDYFVTHFTPTLNQEEQTYFDLIFTSTDEMVAANRAGIVRFDGQEWSLVRTPSAPLSVAMDSSMNMYVGCADDFGWVTIIDGQQRFKSLADDSNRGLTFKTVLFDGKVYFLQGFAIHAYDPEEEMIETFLPDSTDSQFVNMMVFDGVLWAETANQSYYLSDSLQKGNRLLPDGSIVLNYSMEPKSKKIVISGSLGGVFIYTDRFKRVEELSGLSINDLAWVSEDLFVVSTLSEGLFFYDTKKGKVVGNLSSTNGLLDNEVFAIATDGANGVWIANTFGFTRVAPLLPIRSFNHYPGLDGNLTTAAYINDTWNIATSSGVYYFDQIDLFKNVVYYVPKRNTPPPTKTPTKTPTTQTPKEESSALKSVVGGLFSKKRDDQPTLKSGDADKNEKAPLVQLKSNITNVFKKDDGLLSRIKLPIGDQKSNRLQYERRVKKELISTNYLYKQIPDITDKVKQLLPFEDAVIAITPSGILEISDQTAEEVYNEPVRYVFHPEGTRTLWVSNTSGGVTRLDEINKVWVEYQTLNTTGDIVLSIYQDKSDVLWMAGANQLFKVIQTDSAAFVAESYPLENQFFDNIRITEIREHLYLINNQGAFVLDTAQNLLVRDDTLMNAIGQIRRHLVQSDGRVWIHNGNNWIRLESDGSISQFTYLKLFPQMTYIEQLGEELWLINDHQSLFKFVPSENDSIPASRMFFRQIRDREGLVALKGRQATISYDRNSVFIQLSRPDYLDLVNVEYQYRMIGLDDEWSEWTSNSQLDFNYLPPGQYTLEVRSRDTFGRVQESEPIKFKIRPPYWQTAWFSALQVLFFTGLVLIASRMNRRQTLTRKQVIISNLLTIVTIVMVIELLQNLAESAFGDLGSPVLAFGLDVFVALLIFPVEMLLRWVVTGHRENDFKQVKEQNG